MTRLHHEVRIDAPPATVFALLDDLEAVQRYNPVVARTRYTSEARSGVGAARHCEFQPKGFSDERVVGWEQGRVHAMEVVRSSWPMRDIGWRAELRRDGAGTLLVQDTSYVVKGGPVGALLDALVMRRKFAGILDAILAGLKREAEARERAP
ncbi:MAG: SRPBCC family protein [Halobacteriales archaeon]|nr:SRPBCC family protein [Halobacteriales archaeon]